MSKHLFLSAIALSIAIVPAFAAAKGHSLKAPKAPKAQTSKVEPAKQPKKS